jgi:hypothetical protein
MADQDPHYKEEEDGEADEEEEYNAVVKRNQSDQKKREFIRLEQKIELCLKANRLVRAEKKMSLRAFCDAEGIQPSQLRRWEKRVCLMKMKAESSTVTRTTLNVGRPSVLQPQKDNIIPWITSIRDTGMVVTIRMVTAWAKGLVPALAHKKRSTLQQIVRRFLNVNGIVIRRKTHQAQQHPSVAKKMPKNSL